LTVTQDKDSEGEKPLQQALAGNTRLPGDEHNFTLHSMRELAYLFDKQQKYAQASELFRKARNGYMH